MRLTKRGNNVVSVLALTGFMLIYGFVCYLENYGMGGS